MCLKSANEILKKYLVKGVRDALKQGFPIASLVHDCRADLVDCTHNAWAQHAVPVRRIRMLTQRAVSPISN